MRATLLMPLAMVFALGCAVWALIVAGIKGKIVIISVIVIFAILSLLFPDFRTLFNIGALLFGAGCFLYAKWHS
jgi:hypothetical protein